MKAEATAKADGAQHNPMENIHKNYPTRLSSPLVLKLGADHPRSSLLPIDQ